MYQSKSSSVLCRNRSGENEIDARVVFPGAKKNSVLQRDHEKDFVICFFFFHHSSVCFSSSWSTIITKSTLSNRFLSFRTNPGRHRCCPRELGWKLLPPRSAQSPPGISVSIIHVDCGWARRWRWARKEMRSLWTFMGPNLHLCFPLQSFRGGKWCGK